MHLERMFTPSPEDTEYLVDPGQALVQRIHVNEEGFGDPRRVSAELEVGFHSPYEIGVAHCRAAGAGRLFPPRRRSDRDRGSSFSAAGRDGRRP